MTKSEFTTWMTEWARSGAGKQALAVALLTYDPGRSGPGGVRNAGNDAPTNPTVAPAWALSRALAASITGDEVNAKVDAMQATLEAILSDVSPRIPRQVTAANALDADASPEQTAATLRTVLGDRAAEVGKLLSS